MQKRGLKPPTCTLKGQGSSCVTCLIRMSNLHTWAWALFSIIMRGKVMKVQHGGFTVVQTGVVWYLPVFAVSILVSVSILLPHSCMICCSRSIEFQYCFFFTFREAAKELWVFAVRIERTQVQSLLSLTQSVYFSSYLLTNPKVNLLGWKFPLSWKLLSHWTYSLGWSHTHLTVNPHSSVPRLCYNSLTKFFSILSTPSSSLYQENLSKSIRVSVPRIPPLPFSSSLLSWKVQMLSISRVTHAS